MKYNLIFLALLPALAMAEVPNKFVTGTAAKAAQVNENFAHTEAKADANAASIESLKPLITANDLLAEENQTAIASNITSIEDALAQAKTNFESIVTFNNAVAANTTAIQGNAESISANESAISQNTTALATLALEFDGVAASVTTLVKNVAELPSAADLSTALEGIADIESNYQPSPLYNVDKGIVTVDVDCNNDPAALISAYHANLIYSNVSFELSGRCYGDIQPVRGKEEDGSVIIGGQVMSIYSKDPENRAAIITNDVTNKSSLYSGFSGGLYLWDLDIDSNGDNSFTVLFSRNSHGGLTNVNISANAITAITVQEGSQAYISNVTVNEGANYGIVARSNGVVRLLGENNIQGAETGILVTIGSSVRDQSNLIVQGNNNAITISSGSSWQGYSDITATGKVQIEHNASMEIMNLTTTDELNINSGQLKIYETADIGGNIYISQSDLNAKNITGSQFNTHQSNVEIWNSADFSIEIAFGGNSAGNLHNLNTSKLSVYESAINLGKDESSSAFINATQLYRSQLNFNSIDFDIIETGLSSLVELNNSTGQTVKAFQNSYLVLSNSNVTDLIELGHSSLSIYDSELSVANGINLFNSKAEGNSTISPSKFNCSGISSLDMNGWNKVDYSGETPVVDHSTNCVDNGVWSSLIEHHLTTNFPGE
ncbi:MAG: hypothetical protein ACPG8A_06670 [Psychrobium sp.]